MDFNSKAFPENTTFASGSFPQPDVAVVKTDCAGLKTDFHRLLVMMEAQLSDMRVIKENVLWLVEKAKAGDAHAATLDDHEVRISALENTRR